MSQCKRLLSQKHCFYKQWLVSYITHELTSRKQSTEFILAFSQSIPIFYDSWSTQQTAKAPTTGTNSSIKIQYQIFTEPIFVYSYTMCEYLSHSSLLLPPTPTFMILILQCSFHDSQSHDRNYPWHTYPWPTHTHCKVLLKLLLLALLRHLYCCILIFIVHVCSPITCFENCLTLLVCFLWTLTKVKPALTSTVHHDSFTLHGE